MFDFKQLAVKPNIEKKEQQYRLLEQRLQKRRTPLLPIVLPPIMVLIACLLFITIPSSKSYDKTAFEPDTIVQILGTLGEGNPSSIYRWDVKNITSPSLRDSFEQALHEMKPITLSQTPNITYTVQLTYENGVVEQYFIEWAENIHVGDRNGQWYVVENLDLYNALTGPIFPLTDSNNLLILLIMMCLLWVLEKRIRPQGHNGKKLPLYSTKWSYAIDVITLLIIVAPLYLFKNPFVFSSFAAAIIGGGLKLWLEARYGGESWRYKIIVYHICYILIGFSSLLIM
ncbi:hypothetical protein R6U77_04595 [Lysinibacillus louembei]|uniref:DUF4181 domain-containing protein n=1 Tax=Lysinibacillus louembei TaxID=1470088 RepID=A0ABZ0S550_9BACI|nr:hypothetical protein [Lysinibacillus louembei]WPK12977.1 hypothetical protein R6U77_04595 [Lysinibacillus louembei]